MGDAARLLYSREEAAELLGVSLRTFQAHVARAVPRVQIGTRVLYERGDLIEWLERQKVGPSTETRGPASIPSASGTRVSAITGPRAAAIERKLSAALQRSTKKS